MKLVFGNEAVRVYESELASGGTAVVTPQELTIEGIFDGDTWAHAQAECEGAMAARMTSMIAERDGEPIGDAERVGNPEYPSIYRDARGGNDYISEVVIVEWWQRYWPAPEEVGTDDE